MHSLLLLAFALFMLCTPFGKEGRMIAAHHSLLQKSALLPAQFVVLPFVNTNGDTVSGDAKKVNSAAAFNTGFTPTASTVVETIICPGNNGTGGWETFIGGSNNGDAQAGAWLLRRAEKEQKFAFSVNAWTGSAAFASFINESSWCRLRIGIASVEFDIDGTVTNASVPNSSSFTGVAPIWIGASGRQTTEDSYRGCKALIGRTTILDGGVVTRDYIPAQRKADSVCGFFDLITRQFSSSIVPNHEFTSNGY